MGVHGLGSGRLARVRSLGVSGGFSNHCGLLVEWTREHGK